MHGYMKKSARSDTFFRNCEPSRVPEMSLSHSENKATCFPSDTYKLSIRSFLEYCYTIVFLQDISYPSNRCLVHDRNVHKNYSALKLTIIYIKHVT